MKDFAATVIISVAILSMSGCLVLVNKQNNETKRFEMNCEAQP